MKWLLIAMLVSWALAWWGFNAADRPGDDFGAVFPALIALVLAVILTFVYVGCAFWFHQFW